MANNYSVTSFTLYPKDKNASLVLGDLAQFLIQLFTGESPDVDCAEFITTDDSYVTCERFFEALAEYFDLNLEGLFNFNELIPQLIEHFNEPLVAKLDSFLSSIKLDSDDILSLEDLLELGFYEEKTNLGSYLAETGYWCSKNRHGEFGGGAIYVSENFTTTTFTKSLGSLTYGVEEDKIPNYVTKQVEGLVGNIHDKELREKTVKALINLLSKQEN